MKQMKAFAGKWRIAEMEVWDQDYVDMEVPGYFISSATFRIAWIGKNFFKSKIDDGLSIFRAYLQEGGKNLRRILEA